MTTTYKVTNKDYYGAAFALYENGLLSNLMVDYKLATQHPRLASVDFPLTEKELLRNPVFDATELKPRTVAEKVALFCLLYKKNKGMAYRAAKEEKANMKLVTVNEQLLNKYFTSTAYPLSHTKTMADYVRHYNTIRDLATNGTPAKAKYPDVYDREYEKRISDDVGKLQGYWEYLRALGWKKTDGVWSRVA
jgi:hypothetical protein